MHSCHGTLRPGLLPCRDQGRGCSVGLCGMAHGHSIALSSWPPSLVAPQPCSSQAEWAVPGESSPAGSSDDGSSVRTAALAGVAPRGLELGLSWGRGSSERPQSWRGKRDRPKFREWGMQLGPRPGPAALGWGCFSPAGTEGLSHVPPWCLGPGIPAVMYCKYSVCHLLLWDPWHGQGMSERPGSDRDFFVYHKLFVYF